MVISIVIKDYDKYENIENVTNDINNYREVLYDKYNYKLITNEKEYGLKMNKTDIRNYLRKCKKLLIDNNYNIHYDSLILTISGHGTYNSLITSNGDKYYYKDIRQLFATDDELLEIPKLYLIDACRTDNNDEKEDNKNIRVAAGAKTFSTTIMGTSEGNIVRGGKISKFITKYLENNFDLNKNKNKLYWNNFYKIYRSASKDISLTTKNDQALIITEHDNDIDDIVFLPNPNKQQEIIPRIIDFMCILNILYFIFYIYIYIYIQKL